MPPKPKQKSPKAKEKREEVTKMDEKHYMKVSNTAKESLKACNLSKGEWEILVDTTLRIKANVPLRNQATQKEMIWNTLAKIIDNGKLLEVLEISDTETKDDAKTRNEKFLEDAKEILKGNGEAKVVITKEKIVCPLYNKGPNFCKYVFTLLSSIYVY